MFSFSLASVLSITFLSDCPQPVSFSYLVLSFSRLAFFLSPLVAWCPLLVPRAGRRRLFPCLCPLVGFFLFLPDWELNRFCLQDLIHERNIARVAPLKYRFSPGPQIPVAPERALCYPITLLEITSDAPPSVWRGPAPFPCAAIHLFLDSPLLFLFAA